MRHATRELHERIEQALDLLAPGLSPERYRALLERFHGLIAPFEARLALVGGWEGIGIDLDERRKAPLLVRDLRALGLADADIERLPRCGDLPAVSTLADGMDCLYVLEGSTLGGQVISRHVHEALGISAESGGAFFAAYGARTGRMWKAYQEALARLPAEPAVQAALVSAACDSFFTFERWMQGGAAHP